MMTSQMFVCNGMNAEIEKKKDKNIKYRQHEKTGFGCFEILSENINLRLSQKTPEFSNSHTQFRK